MTSQLFMRKVHRILVWFMAITGIVMGTTGLLLRYPTWVSAHWSAIDLVLVRYVHRNISTSFGIGLLLMILTGLWLYIAPVLVRRRIKEEHHDHPDSPPPSPPPST